ncbi:MAG TPA: DUF11 domain-containing protein [Chloroflexi bacterium]|nr:DUF11 domain-containing protein [Chloroflexota bacterium]
MKRLAWMAVICALGGWLVFGVLSWLEQGARAAMSSDAAAPSAGVRDVVINEIAWGGTAASTWDEWIELYNNSAYTIPLDGWTIAFADGSPATITLSGDIGPQTFYLLERDDKAVNNVAADLVYGGGRIGNGGEQVTLHDDVGRVIDAANADGGAWPAGSDSPGCYSMERIDPTAPDADDNWCTNDPDIARNGLDADGNPINGTPKARNSCYQPPADPLADLVVAKWGPQQVAPGARITHHVAFSNTGAFTATGVRVTDTLPSVVNFVAQDSAFAFTPTGQTLVWTVGDLPAGARYAITVAGQVSETATGLFTNYVTATTTASETTTSNNHATWDTTAFIPGQADLVVAKTGPAMATPGRPIVYRVVLSNTGAVTATEVWLTDTLPLGVIPVASDPPASLASGPILAWDLGDVAPGGQRRTTITGEIAGTALLTLTNWVTATTTADETQIDDNHAAWTTALDTQRWVYLPLVMRDYTPPRYGVIIEALLYDGWQTNDADEAVLLLNGSDQGVPLTGWELCKIRDSAWICAALSDVTIAPRQRLWLARSGIDFAASFGFDPDYTLSRWPIFANAGDEAVLRDETGRVRDAVVYKAGYTGVDGWDGAALQPYKNFAEAGQILYRILDEADGYPLADTDTAADWAQYTGDPWRGRRVRYPGWDLEPFFHPAVSASAPVTVGIAPDNAYELVRDTIRSAEERIDLALYSLKHYDLVLELAQQAQRGISVTVLLEGGPVGGVDEQTLWACEQLHDTNHGQCYFMVNASEHRVYDRYTYVHAKLIIVDRKRILVGSQNLTPLGLPGDDKGNGTGGSRGVVLVTDAPEMVARALDIFEADCDPENHADVSPWGPDNLLGYAAPPPDFTPDTGGDWTTYTVQFSQTLATTGDWFEMVTAPESALRTSDGLLGLIARAGAGDGVYVQQLYEHAAWGDNPIDAPNLRLAAYIAAARRGARVRILLNGGDFGIDYFSFAKNVETAAYVNQIAASEGLDMSAHLGDPTQYGIHNKMVLVDLGAEGRYAHVGSINGSETSNKVNREIAIQVRSDEVFDYLYGMFDHDWRHQPPESHVLISEVLYDPIGLDTGREWVEIYNPTNEHVDLSGWYLGDVGPGGEYGSGLYRFPPGSMLLAEQVIVVAQQAADVYFTPDYEFLIDPHRDDPSVPNMIAAGSWDGFGFALGNAGDEVLLLDANAAVVDVVVYGAGHYPGVIAHPGVEEQGHSLERRPPRQDTDDCSLDFFDRYPPTPGLLP